MLRLKLNNTIISLWLIINLICINSYQTECDVENRHEPTNLTELTFAQGESEREEEVMAAAALYNASLLINQKPENNNTFLWIINNGNHDNC